MAQAPPAEAMSGGWIGPMPTQQFINDFLSLKTPVPFLPQVDHQFFAKMPQCVQGVQEEHLHDPFVSPATSNVRVVIAGLLLHGLDSSTHLLMKRSPSR